MGLRQCFFWDLIIIGVLCWSTRDAVQIIKRKAKDKQLCNQLSWTGEESRGPPPAKLSAAADRLDSRLHRVSHRLLVTPGQSSQLHHCELRATLGFKTRRAPRRRDDSHRPSRQKPPTVSCFSFFSVDVSTLIPRDFSLRIDTDDVTKMCHGKELQFPPVCMYLLQLDQKYLCLSLIQNLVTSCALQSNL